MSMSRAEAPLDIRLMNFTSMALVWMFVAGALFVGAHWLAQRPVWAIRSVLVQGSLEHVSAAALRSQAVPRLQGNWFTLDLRDAQQAFAQVPWVRRAVVQRVWPLSLVVTLQAQQPMALWIGASGAPEALVNTEGELFEGNLGEVQDMALPRLSGPRGSEGRVAQMYAQLAAAVAPAGWKPVLVELGAEGNWHMEVDGGLLLDLGSDSDPQAFRQRLQRFMALKDSVQARFGRALAAADLRYANGFAVRLQAPPTPAKANTNTTNDKASRGA